MTVTNYRGLDKKAAEIRLKVLETAMRAGRAHVPPAFSCVDIMVALYYGGALRYDPKNPKMPGRDYFILSKGHACLGLYAILADLGFFPESLLATFEGDGSILAGHPDRGVPGVEVVSGSLGHGLGLGAGLALGSKLDGRDQLVFTLLGDGECDEGSIWEAAMFASHQRLKNLVAIIDRNRLSATDYTEKIVALEPLSARWDSFGWDAVTMDGHSVKELMRTFSGIRKRTSQKPLAIIAKTVKGKGVSFMEGSPQWHHRLPKGEEAEKALEELRSKIRELRGSGT